MHEAGEDNRTEHPLVRITTMGEFALERLVRDSLTGTGGAAALRTRGTERVEQPGTGNGPAESTPVPCEPPGIAG